MCPKTEQQVHVQMWVCYCLIFKGSTRSSHKSYGYSKFVYTVLRILNEKYISRLTIILGFVTAQATHIPSCYPSLCKLKWHAVMFYHTSTTDLWDFQPINSPRSPLDDSTYSMCQLYLYLYKMSASLDWVISLIFLEKIVVKNLKIPLFETATCYLCSRKIYADNKKIG